TVDYSKNHKSKEAARRTQVSEWLGTIRGLADAGRFSRGRGCSGRERCAFAALVRQQDQVGAAPDPELAEEIRDVEFYRALGDVEAAGDFFVGEVFKQSG